MSLPVHEGERVSDSRTELRDGAGVRFGRDGKGVVADYGARVPSNRKWATESGPLVA